MKKINLVGVRFGRLVVIKEYDTSPSGTRWLCHCDCGGETIAFGKGLKKGTTKSCGCYRIEVATNRLTKHGMKHTRQYEIWNKMKDRCLNDKCRAYKHYGGRGIKLYEPWNNFELFWNDMKIGYAENLTLDRKDYNGNYEPSNCRWITQAEQTKNTRSNRIVTIDGYTCIFSDMARKYNISPKTVRNRINMGWSVEDAFKTPLKRAK